MPVHLRGNTGITFAVLAVAVSSFALLQSLIVPVLARIQVLYETDQTTVTWVLTAYLLSASIFTPLLGRLGDSVGKTRMLVVTLTALAVGSLMAALAPSIGWLIVARVVQGAGGGVMPLAFGIIRDEFAERSTLALSVIASLTAVGFGFGLVLAGPIVDGLGYHWLFWLPMIATSVAALAALAFIPASPVRTASRLPLLPAVLLSGFLVAVLLPISQGNVWGWSSPGVVGLLTLGVLLAVLWVRVELTVPVPLIDMAMMRRRGVWTSNLVAAFVGFGMFGSFAFLPQLLQTPTEAGYGFGASIGESGRLLLPSAMASFLIGFGVASLVHRFGARRVIMTGTAMSAVALVSVGIFHDQAWQLYAATSLQGVGNGLVFSSLAGVVIGSVPAEQTGVASGMNANIRTIGGSIGSAVTAGIITARVGADGFPVELGYTIGFVLLGVMMLGATLAASFIPDLRTSTTTTRWEDADNAELGYLPAAPAAAR